MAGLVSKTLLIVWTAFSGSQAIASQSEHNQMCVNIASGKALTIHASPSNRSDIVGMLQNDDCSLKLTGFCEGYWCKVSTDQIAGWVLIRYLKPKR